MAGLRHKEVWTEPTPAVREVQEYLAEIRRRLFNTDWDVTAWRCTKKSCSGRPHEGYDYPHARTQQREPPGDWRVFLMLGGRGSGKTWAASHIFSEWVFNDTEEGEYAIVSPTWRDVTTTCVQSRQSGILAALGGRQSGLVTSYTKSTGQIHLANGVTIHLATSEDGAVRLQGKNLSGVWGDEIGLWTDWETAWDESISYSVRKGRARIIATGTPKHSRRARRLIRRLIDDPAVRVAQLRTIDNADNLSAGMLSDLEAIKGTRLYRQEALGELMDDNPDALWTLDTIDPYRVTEVPVLDTIVIAVDPAMTTEGDETGIIVAGAMTVDKIRHMYVIADLSGRYRPEQMASVVAQALETYAADRVIAEVNQGGDFIGSVIHAHDPTIPYATVRATRGKALRAEPLSVHYTLGRVHHVGVYEELEDQMCQWSPGDKKSPDRLDALVWAAAGLGIIRETDSVAAYLSVFEPLVALAGERVDTW